MLRRSTGLGFATFYLREYATAKRHICVNVMRHDAKFIFIKKNEENDLYKKLYEIARTKEYQI